MYEKLKAQLESDCSEVTVVENQEHPSIMSIISQPTARTPFAKLSFPKTGSFEVYFRGKVIFSKLKLGIWPHPAMVAKSVRDILDGNHEELKSAPQSTGFKEYQSKPEVPKRPKPLAQTTGKKDSPPPKQPTPVPQDHSKTSVPVATEKPKPPPEVTKIEPPKYNPPAEPPKVKAPSPPVPEPPKPKVQAVPTEKHEETTKPEPKIVEEKKEPVKPVIPSSPEPPKVEKHEEVKAEIHHEEHVEKPPEKHVEVAVEKPEVKKPVEEHKHVEKHAEEHHETPKVHVEVKAHEEKHVPVEESKDLHLPQALPHPIHKPHVEADEKPAHDTKVEEKAPESHHIEGHIEHHEPEHKEPQVAHEDYEDEYEEDEDQGNSGEAPPYKVTESFKQSLAIGEGKNVKLPIKNEHAEEKHYSIQVTNPGLVKISESELTVPAGASMKLKLEISAQSSLGIKKCYIVVATEEEVSACYEIEVEIN